MKVRTEPFNAAECYNWLTPKIKYHPYVLEAETPHFTSLLIFYTRLETAVVLHAQRQYNSTEQGMKKISASYVAKTKISFTDTTEFSCLTEHQSASSVCKLTEKNWNDGGCTSHSILRLKWQRQEKAENPQIFDTQKLPHTRIYLLWKCTYVLSNKFIFCVLQGQVSFPCSIFRSNPANKHALDQIWWKHSTRSIELHMHNCFQELHHIHLKWDNYFLEDSSNYIKINMQNTHALLDAEDTFSRTGFFSPHLNFCQLIKYMSRHLL